MERHQAVGWTGFLLLGLGVLGCGGGPEVEVVTVREGEIQSSFVEPARTRLRRDHLLRMPVDARIERIELDPGDPVRKGDELVGMDRVPLEEALTEARAAVKEFEAEIVVKEDDRLESTALVESRVVIEAYRETLKASDAEIEARKARADRATRELERMTKLAKDRAIPQNELEDRQLDAETSVIDLRQQEFYRAALYTLFTAIKLGPDYIQQYLLRKGLEKQVIGERLAQARSRLVRARHELDRAHIDSPVDGVVLEVHETAPGVYPAGHPLLTVGRMEELEIVAEVLTEDALRLEVGTQVRVHTLARPPMKGRVRRIEPSAFTKRSSLGVEQQRVHVLIRIEDSDHGLGVGYRVRAEFLTAHRAKTLVVPRLSVLLGTDGAHYVLLIRGGALVKRVVRLGLESDTEMEILEGVEPGDRLVAVPDTTMRDGESVNVKP